MLIHLVILHLVALILKDACANPMSDIDSPKNDELRMYELLDEYFKERDSNLNKEENKYPQNLNPTGTDKRGKYSWSVAYGKRDRWIAYGKRNANRNEELKESRPRFFLSRDGPRDISEYNSQVKHGHAWKSRWSNKRTTDSAYPERGSDNADSSNEGYFTKVPIFKRQQWTKIPWGKRSY